VQHISIPPRRIVLSIERPRRVGVLKIRQGPEDKEMTGRSVFTVRAGAVMQAVRTIHDLTKGMKSGKKSSRESSSPGRVLMKISDQPNG